MKTLIFITFIITIFILTPSVFSLNAAENVTLTDMYNQWGKILGWHSNISNACSWNGITCNTTNGNIIQMFVVKFC